ncbi:VOC family protein [Ketogulonicigenium vulgare]|uniref:VOC family protein n=1 Tax=Ketogulonicigenium vulgare TaxID=92945 RepID=UPI002358537F|nr:VOC family protein [Ketogulonicigenium vulgare]
MTSGIHHVTAVTANVQRNVDFYAGFLGLRLVKRTGGFEDAEQLHLFYGDQLASPGSLITFLVWPDGAHGRVGLGQVSEIAFAVPLASIGGWLQRAMAAGIPFTGPARELGEPVLRLRDPDGIIVKLVGADLPADAPLPDPMAPTRIRAVTLLTEDAEATGAFVARFGYSVALRDGPFIRMQSDRDVVDIRQSAGFVTGGPGAGIFDHVAFRAPDVDAVRQMRLDLRDHEGVTHVHDRKYFFSLYVREPAGTLIEYATDAPGFLLDERAEDLGSGLFLPDNALHRAADLQVMLPQFALPGAPRRPIRTLDFSHRFYDPADPDGSVIVLLHGSGGTEADLMPIAAAANPRATLIALRGRATEEGSLRWFRRFGAGQYDQADIRAEAAAFAAFMEDLRTGYGIAISDVTFLGYSNGANFIAAAMRLYPQLATRTVLLRAAEVLEGAPAVALDHVPITLILGRNDSFLPEGQRLAAALEAAGAQVQVTLLPAGHGLDPHEAAAVAEAFSGAVPSDAPQS